MDSIKTLSVDIGGTGIKGMVLDASGAALVERVRLLTPRPATFEAVLATVIELAGKLPSADRVSIGFPGVVMGGVVMNAPNLDGDWSEVPLAAKVESALGKPTRAANDADIQGLGAVEGKGLEMILTLGTGMGSAIINDGVLVPNLELGHHPFKKGMSYEDYIDDAARKDLGKKRWSKRVHQVIAQVLPIWNPRVLYLGGGNAKKLIGELPPNVRRAENVAGILGGIKLWR